MLGGVAVFQACRHGRRPRMAGMVSSLWHPRYHQHDDSFSVAFLDRGRLLVCSARLFLGGLCHFGSIHGALEVGCPWPPETIVILFKSETTGSLLESERRPERAPLRVTPWRTLYLMGLRTWAVWASAAVAMG